MKKIVDYRLIVSLLLFALVAVSANAQDRAHILKVYNWADYLDMDLIEEFEQWYEEQQP